MTGSRDPTRSLSLRSEGRGKVTRKVFELHRGMRQAIVDSDIAGLREREPMMSLINWGEASSHRLQRTESVIQATVDSALLNPPDWLGSLIERAVQKGVEQAAQELRTELDHLDLDDVNAVHGFAVMSEVTGIANETIRRTLRHVSDAVERKTSPDILMRDLRIVLEKVTKLRLNMLVNTAVVRAVNAGKLVAYKDQGVKQVGVNPEWMPVPHMHDAKKKPAKKKKAAKRKKGIWGEPFLVNVLTSGDDKVCDDCNDIAEEGPYDIDTAQGLIPSHPNCRCAFVPFDDNRYAPIEEQDEEW